MKRNRSHQSAEARHCKSTDLGCLQLEAEQAAKTLKGAKTALVNAQQAVNRAEEAYANTQKALTIGVEQIKNATKVG